MQDKYKKKQEDHRALHQRQVGALKFSEVSAEKRNQVERKRAKRIAIVDGVRFLGTSADSLSTTKFFRQFQGSPLICLANQRCLGSARLEDVVRGEKRLRDFVFAGSLSDFVEERKDFDRCDCGAVVG